MANRCCNTLSAVIANSSHSHIIERKLHLATSLLASNQACNTSINFICKPIFASHLLQREQIFEFLAYFFFSKTFYIRHWSKTARHSVILHNCFRSRTQHIADSQINWGSPCLAVFQSEIMFTCGLSYLIKRSPLPFCNSFDFCHIFFCHNHTHSFLAFIANYFFI